MKVKLMDFEEAQKIAEISIWEATKESIVCIPRYAWDELSSNYYPVHSSDQQGIIEVDDGGILNWSVPICFIGDIIPEEESKIYEATPVQQELVNELEDTIRSLEVKLRCLMAYAGGKGQPDIAGMISDILIEEDMEVFA